MRPLDPPYEDEAGLLWVISDIIEYGVLLHRRAHITYLPKIGEVVIHSNDHSPPHFHIKLKDRLDVRLRLDTLLPVQAKDEKELERAGINNAKFKEIQDWYLKRGGREICLRKWEAFHK